MSVGKAHDCTRALWDIEGHRWSGDEGEPHRRSRTECRGEPPAIGVSTDEAREAIGCTTEHKGVRAGTAEVEDVGEPSE